MNTYATAEEVSKGLESRLHKAFDEIIELARDVESMCGELVGYVPPAPEDGSSSGLKSVDANFADRVITHLNSTMQRVSEARSNIRRVNQNILS